MFCPYCGAPVQTGNNNCPQCGRIINEENRSNINSSFSGKRSNKTTTIIVSIIAAVLLVSVCILTILEMDSPEKAAERYVMGLLTNNFVKIERNAICSFDSIEYDMTDGFAESDIKVTVLLDSEEDPSLIPDVVTFFDLQDYVEFDELWDLREIDLKVSVRDKNKKWHEKEAYIYVAKYKGMWKVLSNVNGDIGLVDYYLSILH